MLLFVVESCWLLLDVVRCLLLRDYCVLFVVCRLSLFVVYCSSFVARCRLRFACLFLCCMLFVMCLWLLLFSCGSSLYVVRCSLSSIRCFVVVDCC